MIVKKLVMAQIESLVVDFVNDLRMGLSPSNTQ